MPEILAPSRSSIARAAQSLRAGSLVAFPTETVYGLGANALDDMAVARIFEAKGRPQFNPLIIHAGDAREAFGYVEADDIARELAECLWPGPMTLILPKREGCGISELASAGLATLAVRVPRHEVAQELLRAAGVPIAAPSANRSGSISPTTPQHVQESLGDRIGIILAGGPCEVGLESTVIDLSDGSPVILRPGAVTAEDIEKAAGVRASYDFGESERPRSPGQLLRHYAPGASLRLDAVDVEDGEALLAFGSLKFMGIRSGGFAKDLPEGMLLNLSEKGDLTEAAANLFSMLRKLDASGAGRIAVMPIPDKGLGIAINDRLRRAASS